MIGLLKVLWITRESYPRNYSKCWKQQRGLRKSMDPDSEVKKREGLTKRFLKLKEGLCGPRVEIIGTRDWKSGVLAKDLLGDQETTWRYKMP
ncbi:hypothetical protein YC2023_008319 [Brassica napus]